MKEKLGFGELKLKFVVIVFAKNRGFPNRSNGSTIHHQFINIIIDVERCFNAPYYTGDIRGECDRFELAVSILTR